MENTTSYTYGEILLTTSDIDTDKLEIETM